MLCYFLFFCCQSLCLLNLIWFCSLKGRIHTFDIHFWETITTKRVRWWYVIVLYVGPFPKYYKYSSFATSMSKEPKSSPYGFHLNSITLQLHEPAAALSLDCMKLPFYLPAKKEKTILAWIITSMTMVFSASVGLEVARMRIVTLRLLYTRPECWKKCCPYSMKGWSLKD